MLALDGIEDQVRARIREDQRRKKLDEARRAASLSPPPPKLSDAVKRRLREAEGALAKASYLRVSAGRRPPPAVRSAIRDHEARAKRLLREAEDLARSEDESAWFEAAIRETEALAIARGEIVASQPVNGGRATRKVMMSRGRGLEHARDNGYLSVRHGRDETDDLYDTGAKYRDAYEVVDGLVTHRGEGGGGFSAKGPQIALAEAGETLRLLREPLTERQRKVLDAVCGEGLGMDQAAKACRMGTPATRNALRGGLTAALEARRKAWREGRGADLPGKLHAAGAAVARAARGL